jgi:hypothetical protein
MRRIAMTTDDDQLRRDWLLIEAIVGDAGVELWELDDGAPDLAPHEPTEAELDQLAAAVTPAQLAEQRAAVDALIREEWQQARAAKPVRTTRKRETLSPSMSRVELLAMVEQLHAAHPGQFAQHYRNLDGMTDETLRALVEDMLALVDDDE